ncbi:MULTISPECIES: YggS family pyridoxal phosphate-dependent enzyme [unclassified Flavobacterium]|uniref:YggS family pyridoxal phosphate-dependent enzyme n=1 Tax=unclassified Flavobacterium TaxID=196869 RepID=UPI000F0C46C6|nr:MULTISPECIES: YggS family pyridoxal phosphate-dependent enzyme [unclassified Flavobacterium]AYN04164.1 YggS family pyridoxal phosphate-dependent enzyme [Flavobacterium sp. 140616W15]MCD0475493.1 YggS family pyridoxal phosphate-dependent enzyme [Flavobacterium sp. EDS]
MKDTIISNLKQIHDRIENACILSGRNKSDVQLLLATKTVPADNIRIAIEAGETLIGENKMQELRDKDSVLKELHIERHFIGHLQTNKIKDVLKYATCIQSLDRLSLAHELDKQLQKQGKNIDVFVQVNTSYEESKFGLAPNDVIPFIKEIKKYDRLKIKGLMTIGLLDVQKEKMQPSLRLLREIRDTIYAEGIENQTKLLLSMGMSQDLELAIAEGSNIVRIGTSIFGNRFLGKEIWNENIAE